MELSPPHLVIAAALPEALTPLFGISLLERLLRTVQRCGFREAGILCSSDEVKKHLATPSWARSEIALSFLGRNAETICVKDIPVEADRILLVCGGYYYDARLLEALAARQDTGILIDSMPPANCARLWRNNSVLIGGAALLDRNWLVRQDPQAPVFARLASDVTIGTIAGCDAATLPTYIANLRKDVRPVFFPAPSSDLLPVAECFVRNRAQNGTLDFPGLIDSPIEDWIVGRLCRTGVTPNQVTFVTMLIGITATFLFATGHLWWGVFLAYLIEVLDGVDGKLARTKVETTAAGEWEHSIDYCIELSWWTTLAYHFSTQNLPSAFWLLILFVGADIADRLAKRVAKKKTGRNLDDVSNMDRFVRCIGSRRNINIWILIGALGLGDAANGFVLICWWGVATAAVHVVRAWQIWMGRRAT